LLRGLLFLDSARLRGKSLYKFLPMDKAPLMDRCVLFGRIDAVATKKPSAAAEAHD
jgi:hypothetical protein